jgi:hypothetical protein
MTPESQHHCRASIGNLKGHSLIVERWGGVRSAAVQRKWWLGFVAGRGIDLSAAVVGAARPCAGDGVGRCTPAFATSGRMRCWPRSMSRTSACHLSAIRSGWRELSEGASSPSRTGRCRVGAATRLGEVNCARADQRRDRGNCKTHVRPGTRRRCGRMWDGRDIPGSPRRARRSWCF